MSEDLMESTVSGERKMGQEDTHSRKVSTGQGREVGRGRGASVTEQKSERDGQVSTATLVV